jgi:hypothetical protein
MSIFMYPNLIATTGSKAYGLDLMQRMCDVYLDLCHQSMDEQTSIKTRRGMVASNPSHPLADRRLEGQGRSILPQ